MTVFWDVACSFTETNVSEVLTAYIIRIMTLDLQMYSREASDIEVY
jgi:hypothetical protein